MTTTNDTVNASAVCGYMRPTTLVEVIYDLEPYAKHYGNVRDMMNAAVRELVNSVGEEDARTMLAEKGLVLVATFTVRPKGE